ncbi:MAG: HAD-IA family hydrolase [Acidimicrobiales bacterium]
MPPTDPLGHPLPAPMPAVLLDVDGTLVDSEREGHRVAFNLAFERLGLPYRWDEELYGRLLETTGGQSRIDGYLEEQSVPAGQRGKLSAELHALKTTIFESLIDEGAVSARPGVARFVSECEREGFAVGVVTTGTRRWVERLLARLFGPGTMAVVVTGDDVSVTKPSPEAYELGLERLGRAAGAQACTVAVEDSANGLVSARAAGLACVVVQNHYTSGQDFSGADLVLDGFGEKGAPARVIATGLPGAALVPGSAIVLGPEHLRAVLGMPGGAHSVGTRV